MTIEMQRIYLDNATVGAGYRCGFVIPAGATSDKTAVFFVPSQLASVPVSPNELRSATTVDFRPMYVRRTLVTKISDYRSWNMRFNAKHAQWVLDELGAGAETVRKALKTAPAPVAVARAEKERHAKERRVIERAVVKAIAETVTVRPQLAKVERKAARADAGKLPLPGTKARWVFDAMYSSAGVTNAECNEHCGTAGSYAVDGRRFAAKIGLAFEMVTEGRGKRFFLRDVPAAAEAA